MSLTKEQKAAVGLVTPLWTPHTHRQFPRGARAAVVTVALARYLGRKSQVAARGLSSVWPKHVVSMTLPWVANAGFEMPHTSLSAWRE